MEIFSLMFIVNTHSLSKALFKFLSLLLLILFQTQ